jgi:hypothetical protein
MPKENAIYLNLLYSRADTGHFFGGTSATLLTDSLVIVQLVMEIIKWNNRMILIIELMVTDIFTKSKSIKLFVKLRILLISHWVLN